MKFTIAEWIIIKELVHAEYSKVRAAVTEMKREATPEGSTWPDEKKLEDNPEYFPMAGRLNALTNITYKLDNAEF